MARALDAGCDLIGVNSRNLRTFQVDLNTAFRMAKKFPRGVFPVAESGIGSASDIAELRSAGYQAFLIGETFLGGGPGASSPFVLPGGSSAAGGGLVGGQGERYAQFLITGVLGPHSNAHGPNEFLHVPYAKKLTAAVAQVMAACA